jgi:hypothetical protein
VEAEHDLGAGTVGGLSSLRPFLEKVVNAEDRVLLEEASRCLDTGAFRMAYIAVWLACAESMKRKFNDLASSDSEAAKVKGGVEEREANKQSVDGYLLKKARDYGLVSPSDHDVLTQIYGRRCVFGHPYEQSPLPEVVVGAASGV